MLPEGEESGSAKEVVADVLGGVREDATSVLGKRHAINGSYGRGAEGWLPVVEWLTDAAIGKVVTDTAWAGIKAAAREVRDLLRRLRDKEIRFLVSRGAAAMIARDYLIESGEPGVLNVEGVAEPRALAGLDPTELSYLGVEPWLVSVVNEQRTSRYVVAVSPSGEVMDSMRFSTGGDFQAMWGVPPPQIGSSAVHRFLGTSLIGSA